jgi:hypothetical protein
MTIRTLSACIFAVAVSQFGNAQAMDPATCPMHAQHMKGAKHYEGVDKRGDQAMGFNHETNTHHFLMFKDGGAIRVLPKDPSDAGDLETVREHLKMIAGMFSAGDFRLPMFIHDTTVPGTQTMKKLKAQIVDHYEDVPGGAQVRITTLDPTALQAIYKFMRFQIKDHRTGDVLTVSSD